MKTLKYGMLLLVAAALACAGFWLAGSSRKTCPLKIACLSITNSSAGAQSALCKHTSDENHA